jgi:L-alanine-DL-glutamate epimerase-like enolase superfamily enzyme
MTVCIRRIWTQPHNLPLKSALSWGKDHKLEALDHVLVFAELSDGAVGVAEAPPRPSIYGETPESIAAIIAGECTNLLVGQRIESLADIHAAQRRLTLVKNNHTARGALDMALHSAFARSQGKSLAELLGVTRPQSRVSFILGTGTFDAVLSEVSWVYEAGVRVLKVKVGKDFARETEQIQRIRQDYGDTLDLYVDANQCYTLDEAQRYLPQLADLGIQWCEEPLPINQLRERALLQDAALMPLIADDSAFTLPEFERELAFDTFDTLNIKTARNGFSEAGEMLRLAREHHKGVMVGSQAGSLIGCLHALLFSAQDGIDYPTEATFFLKVKDATNDRLTVRDGWIDTAEAASALNALENELLP